MRRWPAALSALPCLLLALAAAGPASADCSMNPADVAPGVTEPGTVPTWRVAGDGRITVADLVTLGRAVRGDITLAWSEPVTAGCPGVPGDLAPGAPVGTATPPYWGITGDGVVDAADLAVALDNDLGSAQFLPGAGRPGETGDRALAGQVLDSATGSGLGKVTVTVSGPGYERVVETDAAGEFLVTGLPFGKFTVVFDGTTAAASGAYPSLETTAEITGPGTTDMPPATLPELSSPATAKVNVAVDDTGAATAPFSSTLAGTDTPDLGVSGPIGAKILIDGVPPAEAVSLSVTPVQGEEMPAELPSVGGKLNPLSVVTIQPAGATFDAGTAAGFRALAPGSSASVSGDQAGIDGLLPNHKLLPVGTPVDLWAYDGLARSWVRRTAPGRQAVVIDLGGGLTAISAPGLIIAGGWYAAVVPVDAACATRLSGRVVDSQGAPLRGVFVGTSVGSFGLTGDDGTFALDSVPAYTGLGAGTCQPLALTVLLRSPLGTAHEARTISVPAGSIQRGGDTVMGDLVLPVDATACLGGRVTNNGAPAQGVITLSGPSNLQVTLDAAGAFFVNGLAPGSWTASYQFAGEPAPRVAAFVLRPGTCASVNIRRAGGTGQRTIDVLVVFDSDAEPGTPNVPMPGALVQLFGTDASSSDGILGVTGQDGTARFEHVDGPFFVTAQADVNAPETGARLRLTTTIPVIDPPGPGIGVLLMLDEDVPPAQPDALVSGTVLNAPANGPTGELRVRASERGARSYQQSLAFPNPGYQLNVRSGRPFDIVLERIRLSPTSDAPQILSALLGPGMSVLPGEDRSFNFDFASPNRVPFNLSMGLSVANALAAPAENFISLHGRGAGGQGVAFDLFGRSTGGPYPASVAMPSLAHVGLTGLQFILTAEEYGNAAPDYDAENFCNVRLGATTPATAAVPYPGLPGIVFPGPASAMPVDAADMMPVEITLPAGDSGNGLNLIGFMPAGLAPEGLDGASWNVFLPASATTVTLRPPPRPVFVAGGIYGVGAQVVRVPSPVDFDVLFSLDVDARLAGLLESADWECEARVLRPFEVTSGP